MAITVTQPVVDTTVGGVLIAQNTSADPGEGDYRSRKFLLKNATRPATRLVAIVSEVCYSS